MNRQVKRKGIAVGVAIYRFNKVIDTQDVTLTSVWICSRDILKQDISRNNLRMSGFTKMHKLRLSKTRQVFFSYNLNFWEHLTATWCNFMILNVEGSGNFLVMFKITIWPFTTLFFFYWLIDLIGILLFDVRPKNIWHIRRGHHCHLRYSIAYNGIFVIMYYFW